MKKLILLISLILFISGCSFDLYDGVTSPPTYRYYYPYYPYYYSPYYYRYHNYYYRPYYRPYTPPHSRPYQYYGPRNNPPRKK